MGGYDLEYLAPLEKKSVSSSFSMFTNRVCKSTKTQIDYVVAEILMIKTVFLYSIKTDHFCSVLFTEVSAGKQKCIRLEDLKRQK